MYMCQFNKSECSKIMNGTAYDKANKIVGELQRQIVTNDNPVQFLRQICVLIKQEDKTLCV